MGAVQADAVELDLIGYINGFCAAEDEVYCLAHLYVIVTGTAEVEEDPFEEDRIVEYETEFTYICRADKTTKKMVDYVTVDDNFCANEESKLEALVDVFFKEIDLDEVIQAPSLKEEYEQLLRERKFDGFEIPEED